MKKYQKINVYEATKKRLKYLFEEFDQIIISFSGGKDSGVMLNMAIEYAKENNLLDKIGVFHLDYECQYQQTTEYVTRTLETLPAEVQKYWFCLPVETPCSTSMSQSHWYPWRLEDKEIWTRELPETSINEENFNMDFDYNCSDYDFNVRFAKHISKNKKTCFLIGIRSQESLQRYKAVTKKTSKNEYKNNNYTTILDKNCVNAYPIYDWETQDIWIANSKFNWEYNKIYDLYYQAGLGIHQMRVASPFISQGQDNLKLYKVLDPNNWSKLIGRVNGVNFTSIYGGTTAMGWQKITKPKNFTWKQYAYFLLDTLPIETKKKYLKKLNVSFKYWLETGGALPKEVIEELPGELEFKNLGKPKNNRNYNYDYEVIKFNNYIEELDIKNQNLLPTWKRLCIAIMKNDTSCKTLGFGQTKDELEKRKNAIQKYKNIL